MFRFSGLKVTIAGTVVLLLIASIVLGNFVTIMFWKKSLVSSEIAKTKYLAEILSVLVKQKLKVSTTISVEELGVIVEPFSHQAITTVIFDGRKSIASPPGTLTQISEQTLRNAGLLQQEITKLDGSFWGFIPTRRTTLLVALPLVGEGLKKHSLALQVTLDPVYQALKQDLKTVFVYLLVNAIILFVIGWYRLVSSVVKPIERMVDISESYNFASGTAFLQGDSASEFGKLSMALNSMLMKIETDREELRNAVNLLEIVNKELVQAQKEMIFAEKLASVGRLAAGLAHEIGNPLGIVHGYVELLKQSDISDTNKTMFANRAMRELDRINALMRQLLNFAKMPKTVHDKCSVLHLINELKEMLHIQKKNMKFTVNCLVVNDEIYCDPDGLRQVLLNCLLNSIDAIEGCDDSREGHIEVTVSEKTATNERKMMILEIRDNGTGIDVDKSLEYFDPFYTTKEPGKGTGLGLSVSHSIIEVHGGQINIAGEKGTGAVVTIEIPFGPVGRELHG